MPSTSGDMLTVAASLLALISIVSAGNSTYYIGTDPCPALCQVTTNNPNNWTTYHHLDKLELCDQPMLLDFAIYTPLNDSSKTKTIRACMAADVAAGTSTAASQTIPLTNATQAAELQVAWWISSKETKEAYGPNAILGVKELQSFFSDNANSDTSVLFTQYKGVSLGVHVGPKIQNRAVAATILQRFADYLQSNDISQSLLMQVCGSGRDSDYAFGIVASTGSSGLEMAQNAVASWSNGTCATGYDSAMSLGNITLLEATATNATATNITARGLYKRSLHPRADCRWIQVVAGDSCGSLARKCGISGAEFDKYNPSRTLCSTLQVGQHVCCSPGILPDFTPKPNSDGSCASYLVKSGDYCAKIAADHSLTAAKIESFNKNTWGWNGCNNLQAGVNMCLSTGSPPMPAPVPNAVCGPQVPGTEKPALGVDLASLNPCPLNACCDVWGQCGTTAEFCTPSGTGAPGTAAPGTNGCISHCGSDIVNNESPPSSFMSVAYFEGFNGQRPCLHMDASEIDTSKYTHVHFGFATITQDYQVDISPVQSQFVRFTQLKKIKRILSFGGWTFSTDPSTYMIFRNGVTAANRNTLATNIANFIKAHNLDGVDIDWEYPGAPDIPGIPSGSMSDGSNYSVFLSILRGLLPGKSVSIAAPASYWYLKGFPIEEIGRTVDYIIFMTYDLHGHWDYGNKFANPGCPEGNCLRSHVNMTETYNALSMITKAGVPSNKIIVGVSSYGRSFKMTTPGCTGPMCTFTGPLSGATPGVCTQTAGYISNAEINIIIARNGNVQQFKDAATDSNILVYDSVQWVAYMDDNTKDNRTAKYRSWNFGGVTDWAVDLQSFSLTEALPSTTQPGIQGAMNPYLKGCSDDEKKIILQTWQEAGQLANDHYEWVPNGKWQDAMTMYMGEDSKNDYSFWTGKGPLMRNVRRQYEIHHGWWGSNPWYTYAYFYCNEKDVKKNICTPRTFAYTWDDLGTFWSNHYVVFCPLFFDESSWSLKRKTDYANGRPSVQRTMDEWFETRAITLFHETYHWKDTVSVPKCNLRPEVYSPRKVVELAKNNQKDAHINAESWAQAAMAVYLQKTFHLDSPPTPLSVSNQETPDRLLFLDSPPDGWERPVPLDSPVFDPSGPDIVQLSDVGQLFTSTNTVCSDGLYTDIQQCATYCYNGQCSHNSDPNNLSVTCNCAGGPCKPGSYDNFDMCLNNCFHGLCTESAGVKGITCSDCP